MRFMIVKLSNGFILSMDKPGILGGFQKPERFVYHTIDEVLAKIKTYFGGEIK